MTSPIPATLSEMNGPQNFRTAAEATNAVTARGFRPTTIDDSPQLLEMSHRMRYQAYCLERRFLRPEDYPEQLEFDEFDSDSVHIGVLDLEDQLVGTARIVKPTTAGLPALRHCTLFSDETLADRSNTVVEISRVCINRGCTPRRTDDAKKASAPSGLEIPEYGRPNDVFATLVKALYHATKRLGATHWLVAIEKPLRRRIARYGLPFQLAGPEVDYHGIVAPYIMKIAELDQVILQRKYAALDDFPLALEPGRWPQLDQHNMRLLQTAA